MQIEGHIEEIDLGESESDSGPAPERGNPVRRLLGRAVASRRVRVMGALVSIGALGAAALIVPRALPAADESPSPSPSDIALESPGESADASASLSLESPTPSASPTAAPTRGTWPAFPTETAWDPGPQWTPEPQPQAQTSPFPAKGWPVKLSSYLGSYYENSLVGLDGTLYITGVTPIDSTGHARNGFAVLPSGNHPLPAAFGSDGTVYMVDSWSDESGNGGNAIYVFGSNGKLLSGWPVQSTSYDINVEPGPSGSVYVLEGVQQNQITVRILSAKGASQASWSFSTPGGNCGWEVGPDGTLFFAYKPSFSASDCAIRVFDAKGQLQSKSPARGWNGFRLDKDGTAVAWGYDYQPYSNTTVAQTRIAVIGADGQAAAGWPVTFEGTVSPPAFTSDGSIVVTQAGLGTSPSKIIALDRAGVTKTGWPVAMPTGYGPLADYAPVPGANGVIYVAAIDRDWMGYVLALDASGAAVPGWPYKLPQAFANFSSGYQGVGIQMLRRDPDPIGGDVIEASRYSMPISGSNPGPLYAPVASGDGLLYLALDDSMVALSADGQVASGWPYALPSQGNASWIGVGTTPDGGLTVLARLANDPDAPDPGYEAWVFYRLSATGKIVK
jgi:hypothetical protein